MTSARVVFESKEPTIPQPTHVQDQLMLRVPPVAIGLFADPPAGVEHYTNGPVPAGCTFWQLAQQGLTFYTLPADHLCAVGSYTHSLAASTAAPMDLPSTVQFMIESEYLKEEEISSIPTLEKAPELVAYGPADAATFEPSVVVVAAEPGHAMVLFEASLRAGAGDPATTILGRPGCGVVPQTVNSGRSALSFGCIGNRTYTGLPDSELYLAIPGDQWEAVAGAVDEITGANTSMESYYQSTLVITDAP
jgi:uncharacterized protein (DUF169 family)